MQCLYCGGELGLLKELTDGEFCSRDHRQRYKKLTKLALQRLGTSGIAQPIEQEPERQKPGRPIALPAAGFAGVSVRAQSSLTTNIAPSGVVWATAPRAGSDYKAAPLFDALVAQSDMAPRLIIPSSAFRESPNPSSMPASMAAFQMLSKPASVEFPTSNPQIPAFPCPERTALVPALPPFVEVPRFIPEASRHVALRDESSVNPLHIAIGIRYGPGVEFTIEQSALAATTARPITVAAVAEQASPVATQPATIQLSPARPEMLQSTTVKPPVSHRYCPDLRALPVAARGSASAAIMEGAGWSLSGFRLALPAGSAGHITPAALGPAVARSALPVATPLQAGAKIEPSRLEAVTRTPRMLELASLSPRLALRPADMVERKIKGLDMMPSPVGLAEGPSLVTNSMLPALASLFRYGRSRNRASSLVPLVGEPIAPQRCPAKPLAFSAVGMRPPRPVLCAGEALSIIETFQYLRPLEAKSLGLLQALMHLWRSAPAYLRYASATASVILLLWAYLVGAGFKGTLGGSWGQIEAGIRGRAAVELSEDFQGGMQEWDGRGNWDRSWRVQPAGYVNPGNLALYQPSMKMESYRVEFMVQIEQKGVGWVYRAKDEDNYYAAKLTVLRPGPLPLLELARYPVIEGKAGPKVEIPIRVMLHNGTPYRVQMSVEEGDYSTSIEGQLIDFWHDERLKVGGVGFFTDKGDRARIYWMKLSQKNDLIGRVCAYFYPNPIQTRSSKRSR
jgi:hypothetical protein